MSEWTTISHASSNIPRTFSYAECFKDHNQSPSPIPNQTDCWRATFCCWHLGDCIVDQEDASKSRITQGNQSFETDTDTSILQPKNHLENLSGRSKPKLILQLPSVIGLPGGWTSKPLLICWLFGRLATGNLGNFLHQNCKGGWSVGKMNSRSFQL